jgi:UDP-N-acetylglucosamine transferase subunit ALG13
MKILLNAEAFGFGPSAAISNIFNILKEINNDIIIDYVGDGHTLNFQSKLNYQNIFKYDENFHNLIINYDFFITAMDFEKAKISKEYGVKTIVFDTLLWYWKNDFKFYDYYIVQDFFFVKELIKYKKNVYLIEPLLTNTILSNNKDNSLIINFGGLENPFWDIEITVKYISNILKSILPFLKTKFEKIHILCSETHINYLTNFNVKNLKYFEVQELLSKASYIIATPGLGNIYEIAKYEIPSLFLPPANDSQGQQLMILKNEGLIDNYIEWNENINYFNNQNVILEEIKQNIENNNVKIFNIKEKTLKSNFNLNKIFNLFGNNGQTQLKNILKSILK